MLPRKLLDEGQGKFLTDMEISNGSRNKAPTPAPTPRTNFIGEDAEHVLLPPPIIEAMGKIAMGETTSKLRKQNKPRRTETLLQQPILLQWERHNGARIVPEDHWKDWDKTSAMTKMAPQGLALKHKAAYLLSNWEQLWCPTQRGRDWTLKEIQAAINHGPHKSALKPNAIAHFKEEGKDKVAKGQARVVLWENIKHNHPLQLKVLPVAAIPHKSRAYRSILDLLFTLCLEDGGVIKLVNDTTEKMGSMRGNQPNWSLPQKNYPRIRRGGRQCSYLNGQMGYPG
jgi:hypothetical protein